MKVAFAGKGGVGKTTLAALFIKALAKDGQKVLAVDCDPVANLGRLLGLKDADKIVPIVELKALIAERMEVSPDKSFYKLNPRVDDIPERFAKNIDNIKLIVMGTVKMGGYGCMCPESNFLKALLSRLLLEEGDSVVMDMEAGVEHLGRATAGFVDELFVVTEPTIGSIEATKKIYRLASDINIKNISAILNKMRKNEEIDFVRERIAPVPLAGAVPFNQMLPEFEMGKAIEIEKTDVYSAVLDIKNRTSRNYPFG